MQSTLGNTSRVARTYFHLHIPDGSDVSGAETQKAGSNKEKGRARKKMHVRVETEEKLPYTTVAETEDTVGERNPRGRDTDEKASHIPGGAWLNQVRGRAGKRDLGIEGEGDLEGEGA
ncbi:hypothetical protein NDU88_005685 [Pleurodeles waltl]|uniref:Uncharacterized protein n=1 Tax=Pleurodeles waltl TaxID=8319 RepID=A0AAV7VNC2_PLEWA|nr:hypothetical protein NDU88_005685 [Pleurodeles waltl]